MRFGIVALAWENVFERRIPHLRYGSSEIFSNLSYYLAALRHFILHSFISAHFQAKIRDSLLSNYTNLYFNAEIINLMNHAHT
jgi:hypothetical protein